VLQRARNVRLEGDDLLTILWDADLEFFKHSYVDLLAEGVEIPESPEIDVASFANVLEGELALDEGTSDPEEDETTRTVDGEESEASSSATVNREDFNPTLYALDPAEMEALRGEVNREMTRDLRNDVLLALFDRLEDYQRRDRQLEILKILSALLPNLLSQGALRVTSQVLDELTKMQARGDVLDDRGADIVTGIVEELSAPESVQELVRAFQDGSIPASVAELSVFLRYLHPGALGPLVRAAEQIAEKELQAVLQESMRAIADRNHAALFKLMESPDPVVVAGAVRLAGRMELAEAGATMSKLFAHPDAKVRLAAVESSILMRTSTVTKGLQAALGDRSREVRIAAARGLAKLDFRLAAPRLRDYVTGKAIRQADLTEKIAFFESYGDLQDDQAVDLLGGMLNGRGFLGRKEPPEIRACAALALGRLKDARAKTSLEAALDEDDPVIRSAVRRALRREPDAS
ncbi:MAG: HEAT repeat domain-containing protein, partial [Gemmatimonadota bacterium]